MAANSNFMAALNRQIPLTPAMERVVGEGPLARKDVVKNMWLYIKKEGIQDKVNINLDDAMRKALRTGKKVITMFEMNKLIKNGFTGPDAKKKGASKRKAKAARQGSCKSYEPPHHNVYKRKKTGRRFCRKSASGTRKKSNKA